MRHPVLSALCALAVLPVLGGCAAALIPLAAGGAIAGKDELGLGKKKPQLPLPASAPQSIASAAEAELAALPEPEPAALGTIGLGGFDDVASYAMLQAQRDPIIDGRQSAILQDPGSLDPARTDCSIRPAALLIDLDAGQNIFDPAIADSADSELGALLASVRRQQIEIFWISSLSAAEAGPVRRSLINSGLDPDGRDGLLLMRKASDRKQLRRRELDQTHCIIAIAGDNRADFDELYLYLRDPSAAQRLEELIGAGWFLTPLPLTEGHTQ